MRYFSALLASAMAALATAYTEPDYNQSPTGNTITKPGLHDMITAGKPYTIEWKPSTEGPVSLVLLRGPSTNVKPITTLAESIDNSGSYEFIPSPDLKPDTTHYGLMLVVEGTGQYQYSTQFGVDNPHYHGPANATTTAGNATSTAGKTKTGAIKYHTYYSTFEVTRTFCPKCSEQATATPTPAVSKATIPVSVSSHAVETTSSRTSAPTQPTTVATVTVTAAPTADSGADVDAKTHANADSSPTAPAFTGAAGRNTVGLGGVAIAVGVLAVLAF